MENFPSTLVNVKLFTKEYFCRQTCVSCWHDKENKFFDENVHVLGCCVKMEFVSGGCGSVWKMFHSIVVTSSSKRIGSSKNFRFGSENCCEIPENKKKRFELIFHEPTNSVAQQKEGEHLWVIVLRIQMLWLPQKGICKVFKCTLCYPSFSQGSSFHNFLGKPRNHKNL